MSPAPYYQDEWVTLYHGDCREVDAWLAADVLVTDPPYAETNLSWDSWPDGWPASVARSATVRQMWCFGSTRMFLDRRDEFSDWRLAQDVVWQKPRGRGTANDRFSRSHELVLHWYRGAWGDLPLTPPRVLRPVGVAPVRASRRRSPEDGSKVKPMGAGTYQDDGTRLILTVMPGDAGDPRKILHPTQKPLAVLEPLIRYSCPPPGTVADPFAGSGSTLVAAKRLGRKAIGVELDERYCEIAAKRLAQGVLDFGASA